MVMSGGQLLVAARKIKSPKIGARKRQPKKKRREEMWRKEFAGGILTHHAVDARIEISFTSAIENPGCLSPQSYASPTDARSQGQDEKAPPP